MEKTIKKECIYVYNWVILLYSRVWHSIVNRLDFSKRYINTHTQKTLSFYYLTLLWVRNPEVQCGPAGFFAYSLPRLVWGCAVGHVCFLGMDPLQAHSGSELSSVSCSPGTEAPLSLQTVDQGLVLAARILAAFLHVLSALPVSLPLHPRQQRMTSLIYFRFLWHQ